MNVGEVLTFNYTGAIQTANLIDKGIYKLEVWGAQGEGNQGGKGGYSVGYISITNSLTLYVCVGGSGGYNGGGDKGSQYGGHGGGATHIAKVSNTLRNIGYTSFVNNGNGLIVAGGGGGGNYTGGTGGGTTGGNGSKHDNYPSDRWSTGGKGGTQSAGGEGVTGWDEDKGYCTSANGGFGYGSNGIQSGVNAWTFGGGGGFYGGSGGASGGFGGDASGGGGSGWIGGVPAIAFKGTTYSPSMSNGSRSGNGLAKITYVAKAFPDVKFNGTTVDGAYFDLTEVDDISFDSILI